MKKKILFLVTIVVLFATILSTSLITIIINIVQLENTKNSLKNINYLVAQTGDKAEDIIEKSRNIEVNDVRIRFTLINRDGNVIYDNFGRVTENHKNRHEVKEAFENGESECVRTSESMKVKFVYCAVKINDNLILRSSVAVDTMHLFHKSNIIYFIIVIMCVMIFSIFLAVKLASSITKPLTDLVKDTVKLASGNYKIRTKSSGSDELGNLSDNFNKIAEEMQQKIEEAVENKKRLEIIFNNIENGIIAIDRNNKIFAINPAAEMILGIKRNIKGMEISEAVENEKIIDFIKDKKCTDKEIKIMHPIERDMKLKKIHIFEAEPSVIITFNDITDIKRIEIMRRQFAANITHELKTPLTSIKGFAETLRAVDDAETKNKFLNIIDKEVERLTALINDILELSKMESNLVADIEEFRPDNIINYALNIIKTTAESQNIKIKTEIKSTCIMLGDKEKFYQLVLNLIDNAVKYSKAEGGTVKITSYNKEEKYYFIVEDNGIGIPEHDISRIFERFYRVEKSRKKGGTGLGLAIVKHIVKNFKGTINVESKLGKGTKFEVIIPIN